MTVNVDPDDGTGARDLEGRGGSGKPALRPGGGVLPKKRGGPARLAPEVEGVVAAVIDAALGTPPVRGAKHYYRNVARHLGDTDLELPSPSAFDRMFAAERKRRRDAVLARAERTATHMGEIVGTAAAFVPGGPPIARRQCELVVSALATFRSPGPLDAYRDYLQMTYRAGVRSITQADFRARDVADVRRQRPARGDAGMVAEEGGMTGRRPPMRAPTGPDARITDVTPRRPASVQAGGCGAAPPGGY